MKAFLYVTTLIALAACATSPAQTMTPQQVAALTDVQLCDLDYYYRDEPKTMQEIARRGLPCDPDEITCMKRGIERGSPLMPLCMASADAEWQAQVAIAREEARRDWATYELGTAENTQHIYIHE